MELKRNIQLSVSLFLIIIDMIHCNEKVMLDKGESAWEPILILVTVDLPVF